MYKLRGRGEPGTFNSLDSLCCGTQQAAWWHLSCSSVTFFHMPHCSTAANMKSTNVEKDKTFFSFLFTCSNECQDYTWFPGHCCSKQWLNIGLHDTMPSSIWSHTSVPQIALTAVNTIVGGFKMHSSISVCFCPHV